MSTRTFDDVIAELDSEGHLALADLVRLVAIDESLRSLQPDCSHLRLILRQPNSSFGDVMVAHESVDRGGRRSSSDPNAKFELAILGESGPQGREEVVGIGAVIARLRAMLQVDLQDNDDAHW